jgi:hypothetical protein
MIYKLIHSGKLPCYKAGYYRFRESDIAAYIEDKKITPQSRQREMSTVDTPSSDARPA